MIQLILLVLFISLNLIGDDYILNLTGKRVYNSEHNYTEKIITEYLS